MTTTSSKLSIALAAAVLAAGLASCASTDPAGPPPSSTTTSTAAPAATSVFGDDRSDIGFRIHEQNARAIIETVEERGGTPEQAIAALLAAQAETGWRSGLPLPAPSTDIRDIYGWRFSYNIGADGVDAVRIATYRFMDSAAAVTVDPADPVAYALAVQRADTREYVEQEHFYKRGQTAASEYASARPLAEAAYAELRGTQ